MKPSVCFFTITGGGEDYDLLLGCIEHHARMGDHVVLDTTPPERARTFRNLPSSVEWVYEPNYGSGWSNFRFRAALARSLELARAKGRDIVVQLDSDEYFSEDSPVGLFPHALDALVSVETLHWVPDRGPLSFGKPEYHARLWPTSMEITFPVNTAWVASPHYNGNPDHHALVSAPPGAKTKSVDGQFHYHLHYLVGEKAKNDETARTTIQGWPNGTPVRATPLPTPILRWMVSGIKPSARYE
jgi:hypothetical protein